MALKCGIVGLPNVGKSMLFNALSNGSVPSENFPFCTIEPNVAPVFVPDERMDLLASWVNAKQKIPAVIGFVDIAGLVQGAHAGEGLGNKFLSHIREVDAIIHVVRCFHDPLVVHVAGKVDPVFDKQVIDHEMQCKDIETLTKKIAKLDKLKHHLNKTDQKASDLARICLAHLEQNLPIRTLDLDEAAWKVVASWQLITAKPVIYFANVGEEIAQSQSYLNQLSGTLLPEKEELVVGCSSVEVQLQKLSEDEKQFFREEYALEQSSLDQLIRLAYAKLSLITYFTAGPKEVRAWTIKANTRAEQAAGVIHSDFEHGFIKAEVIGFNDYQTFQNEAACKQAGKVRLEGKDYLVQDGDVILFRFNV